MVSGGCTSYRQASGSPSDERRCISASCTAIHCGSHTDGSSLAVRIGILPEPGSIPVVHPLVFAFAFAFVFFLFLSPFLSLFPFTCFALRRWRPLSLSFPSNHRCCREMWPGRGCNTATMSCRNRRALVQRILLVPILFMDELVDLSAVVSSDRFGERSPLSGVSCWV